MEQKNEKMLDKSARIVRLDSSNATFGEKNGFLCLTVSSDEGEEKYDRVFLHRAFPYELPYEYISVLGEESREIGLIYSVDNFDKDTAERIKAEIDIKYYSPVITEIKSVKERYGFSYWKAVTEDKRDITFTMRDTFKNIIHIGDDSIMLVDVDQNRYTVEKVSELSSKSYRKIELYL